MPAQEQDTLSAASLGEGVCLPVPYRSGQTIANLAKLYTDRYPNVNDRVFPVGDLILDARIRVEFSEIPPEAYRCGINTILEYLASINVRGLNAAETLALGLKFRREVFLGLGQRSEANSKTGVRVFIVTHDLKAMVNSSGSTEWLQRCKIPATRSKNPVL
jgi:hypothetical protein